MTRLMNTNDEVMSKNAEEVAERETSNEGNDAMEKSGKGMPSSSSSESDSSGDGDPDGAAAFSSKAKGTSQKAKAASKKGAAVSARSAKGKAKAKSNQKQTPKSEPVPKTSGTKRKVQELDTSSVVIPNHLKVKAALGDLVRKSK